MQNARFGSMAELLECLPGATRSNQLDGKNASQELGKGKKSQVNNRGLFFTTIGHLVVTSIDRRRVFP